MKTALPLAAITVALAFPVWDSTANAQGYYEQDFGYGFAGTPIGGCENARRDGQVAGALIGGVLGGVAGGLIVDDDDHYRGFRGHRGFRGRGRGFHNRHWRGYGRRYRGGNGDEVAGVLLGAVVGGLAGSELGRRSVDCDTRWQYNDVPPPTRSAVGPAWEGGTYTVSRRDVGIARDIPDDGLFGAPDEGLRECETVYRETEFPDGRIVREPVLACREGEIYYEPRARFDEWRVAPDCGLQTRDPNCIGG